MKRNIVIAALAAAALIGGGTATALATTGDDEGPERQTTTRVSDDDGTSTAPGVSAPEAIASALRSAPGTAVSAELDDEDDEDGRTVWEVDVLTREDTWRSVTVDAGTGKVLDTRAEDDDDTAAVRAALKGATVTASDAAKAVAGQGGEVTSVDLDEDGRTKGWEVESDGSDQEWRVGLKTPKATTTHDD